MSDLQDRDGADGAERFFSVKQSDRKDSLRSGGGHSAAHESIDSDDQDHKSCLTLRVLQYLLPCLRNKGVWEPSQGDVFKSHDAEEAKYPRTLRILESRVLDAIFVSSCLLSIFLFLFSEGFLLESRLLWGIIHLVNAVYALGLFSQWLQILIKSKYAKTNHGYTTRDILYTLLSVFPVDLIVLVIYTLNDEDDNEDNEAANPVEHWMITVSRLNYFLRIRSILQYFSKWENHLVVGDFAMFILRTCLFTSFLLHMFACIWHRLACRSFRLKHFLMTPDEATTDVCGEYTWIGHLKLGHSHPLLDHPDWHVLLTHYLVSIYWTIIASFRLGAGDITTMLTSNAEVAFVSLTEITAWIYVLVNISGTLASLFIEKDTEQEHFLTRCFAIRHYLRFTEVTRSVQDEVSRFYTYLWTKSKGIVHIDLIDVMPHAMKSEVFYDVNKFVMDQLPMLKGLDTPFLMSLSVHTTHKFFLSGEILFRRNDTATAMYYLVKGHLEILGEDDSHSIATIRSGSIIGEVHLLQPYPHICTVRCGSDCDLLVLSRQHFRQVLNVYPQYIPVLELRLENRLEQSSLLLALCEKHNSYQKAFKALREAMKYEGTISLPQEQEAPQPPAPTTAASKRFSRMHSFENVTKILGGGGGGGAGEKVLRRTTDEDFDGLDISGDMEAQLHHNSGGSGGGAQMAHVSTTKCFEEAWAVACLALETDVARAGSLATDLNIPRPPIIVAAPDVSTRLTLAFNQSHGLEEQQEGQMVHRAATRVNVFVHLFKCLRESGKAGGTSRMLWDFLVSFCALSVFWYYPYQFAFLDDMQTDYIFHFMDVIFAMDCVYDMIQVVVTPQRTFEGFKEILVYRLKTVYFYIRVISFIPLEYIFATPIGIPPPYFYLFKFNRLLEIHQVFPVLSALETQSSAIFFPVLMVLAKLALGIIYVAHIFAVGYEFVLRATGTHFRDHSYRQAFYRSLVVTTSTGYGDLRSESNWALLIEVLGLICGVSALILLQAKVTAMLVNSERQRVSFQQTYYDLKAFMKQRKFPRSLRHRVNQYYSLQWHAHEGTLIPREGQIIWDAPRSLITKVSSSVALKYVSRIPIFHLIPLQLQQDICLALNHYIIPPGEVLLYPEELVRDLYIISKGFVEVIKDSKVVGVFTEGRYFGLGGLLHGQNTNYMFRTVTHCQVLCLPFESFMNVAHSSAAFLQDFHQLQKKESSRHPHPPPNPDKSLVSVKSKKSGAPSVVTKRNKSPSDSNAHYHRMPYPTQADLDAIFEAAASIQDDHFGAGVEAQELLPSSNNNQDENFWRDTKERKKSFARRLRGFKLSSSWRPDGTPLKFWTAFRVFCGVIAAIFAPLQLAFPIKPSTSFALTFFLDLVAWTDILISLRTAYLGDKNQRVTSSCKMAWHYLKGTFLLDLLGCLPADYVLFFMLVNEPNFDHRYHLVSILRLNRILQVLKLIIAKNLLEKMMFKSLSFIMLLEMVPILCVFMNLSTCVSILSVCQYTTTGLPTTCGDYDAWILNGLRHLSYKNQVEGLYDAFASYVVGLYWVTQSIFCVGFGDIAIGPHATNQLLAILVIIGGILTVTYVGGKLTSCICGENPAKIELQERMKLMDDYLEQHRVSRSARQRVSEVYLNSWNKTRGVSPGTLFQALPPTLKTDVLKQLYGSSLRSSPLFQDLDGPGLRMLASMLSEIFYSEGEFLIKFGDLCSDIFFIANGAVVCYNVRGDIMSQLGVGSLIGEVSPLFNTHRLYTAIAVKDVHAYVFQREQFTEFLEQYPEIKGTMEQCSVRHYKEAMLGSKKGGSVDLEVLLSIQNEKEGPEGKQLVEVKSQGSVESAASKNNNKDPLDLTRNVLQEDIMKSPDELTKAAGEQWWSVFVTFGRMSRDEMGLVHVYQESDKCSLFNFTIHPASTVCGWVSFCLVLTALSCGITAYEVAFSSRHRKTDTLPITVARNLLEVFYLIRILGNFHLGYYDETNTLITDVKLIWRRYARKVDGLWLDFVTTFPFYMAEYFVPGLKGEYLRSVQLLRVALFVRYLKETDSSLKMKASRVKVLKITILLCFIFHFWACAWYLVACTDECTNGSWMQEVLNSFGNTPQGKQLMDENVSTASRYLLSLYYVTNALTYTGFDEIRSRTQIELCLSICMIFATVFVIGYLVGEMVQCLASQVATKIHYQHKLSVLENHFETLGISQDKIHEVRHYFKLLWCRCRGMMFFSLMEQLPYTLRADVAMEIYGPNMKSSRILGKLDENLIRQLCAKIRHEIYFPGSHIVRAGDVVASMYFIKKGEVVILDGNSNLELCVEILYENECFGEVKILLTREQYRFSYVARLESEVGVLYKEDLEQVLGNHPRILEELKEKANRVKVRRQSLKEDEDKERASGGGVHKNNSSMSIKSALSQGSNAGKYAK